MVSLGLLILAIWLAWAGFANVAVYRSSTNAHIETDPPPSHVASGVTGIVTQVGLHTGGSVNKDDVLLQIDPTQTKISVDKANRRITAIAPQVESLEREVSLLTDEVLQRGTAERGSESEVLAKLRGADADLKSAEHELALETDAVKAGVSPVVVRDRADIVVQQKRAALDAIQHESEALVATHRAAGDSRRGLKEQLERQYSELSSDLEVAKSQLAQSEAELERLTIRAPVTGVLGEVMQLRPGAVVHQGDVIGTIVPDHSKLHVIASYGPEALGLLKQGQPAYLRLDGFPWTHYGTLSARVTSVGSELRDKAIRVELELGPDHRIATANGMTGGVDIEVDRVSPFGLFMRMIGEGAR